MSAARQSALRIAVLMGGASAERNVSFASGFRIYDALVARGHDVSAVDPAVGAMTGGQLAELRARAIGAAPPTLEELAGLNHGQLRRDFVDLPEVKGADVVFLALHGGQGEDGTVQAMLDAAGVRYTGSGHLASALAMDKDLSKTLFRAAGVGTADWLMAPQPAPLVEQSIGWPAVVKPSKQGSTVGLTIVNRAEELGPAIRKLFCTTTR